MVVIVKSQYTTIIFIRTDSKGKLKQISMFVWKCHIAFSNYEFSLSAEKLKSAAIGTVNLLVCGRRGFVDSTSVRRTEDLVFESRLP